MDHIYKRIQSAVLQSLGSEAEALSLLAVRPADLLTTLLPMRQTLDIGLIPPKTDNSEFS